MQVQHGYLYLADLNPGRGTESGKIRPVIVIQTDFLNKAKHPSTWIIPCTTKTTGENILRVVLPQSIAGNSMDCEAMIDQNRTIDNKRLRQELGKVPPLILKEIKEKLRLLGNL
jgi:mRNA interferase MazF